MRVHTRYGENFIVPNRIDQPTAIIETIPQHKASWNLLDVEFVRTRLCEIVFTRHFEYCAPREITPR